MYMYSETVDAVRFLLPFALFIFILVVFGYVTKIALVLQLKISCTYSTTFWKISHYR